MYAFEIVVVLCFAAVALSHQKPVDTENVQSSDKKVNATGTSDSMVPKESDSRTFGLLNKLQQQQQPAYYPAWPYQAPMSFRNDNSDAARTLHRPQLYSQGYTSPQVLSLQTYNYPQSYSSPIQSYQYPSYEYQSPYLSGLNHGYSYGGYQSYYKNAEEDKARQFMNFMPADKYISPANTGAQYETRYLLNNPSAISSHQGLYQPQMNQHFASSPFWFRNGPNGRDAAEDKIPQVNVYDYPSYPRSAITIDDKLQLQIPNDYLLNRLQHLTPADLAPAAYSQQPISRAAEEPQTMVWGPSMVSPKAGIEQGYLNPEISQEDGVYMEPIFENHQVKGSRAAEYQMSTYPNLEQQLRMGQMQYWSNNMNNAALENELLAKQYAETKETMQQGPAPASRSAAVTPEEMAQLTHLLQKVSQAVPFVEKQTTKGENQDQNVSAKSSDPAVKTKA